MYNIVTRLNYISRLKLKCSTDVVYLIPWGLSSWSRDKISKVSFVATSNTYKYTHTYTHSHRITHMNKSYTYTHTEKHTKDLKG